MALTRGVQKNVMACVEHFALHSMDTRFRVDVRADEAFHEVFLAHFSRMVDEGVVSIMFAYNSVNEEWCGQSRALLTDVLRDQLDFEGFFISDFSSASVTARSLSRMDLILKLLMLISVQSTFWQQFHLAQFPQ